METFWESSREDAMKIINFKNKKMLPLSKEEFESYLNQINYHTIKKNSNINTLMIKIIANLRIIAIIQVNTKVLHTAYVI